MIHIIDYGLGNIHAFVNVYKRLNIPVSIAKIPEDLANATHLILPGVGSFDHAMDLLNKSGLRKTLDRLVIEEKLPVIGICVGMQMLAESSEEGKESGLGWIKGRVRSFANSPAKSLPMPHMGWNDVQPNSSPVLFKELEEDSRFYFLHSFYFECTHETNVAAFADYGFKFPCAVQDNNIIGVQFHPEKSHHWGSMLLNNFTET